ncbi:ESCRT-III subunit protein SNF7 [Aspergillus aculeatinus CBS 121060]|uniref:Snf7-domain-containing protein n=1 Tax=Aspergillus aculeatinus CBS 121060 TaxID=1448322 RepID=A0ACD1GR88_9EURO|nr:Snf7-domain-containing protein [Aspergillus aculeatinus CBS 121060]RAH63841.1 Snf7-domain-containing protein [Aspergillus aculeatinus CBS 121060]
MWSWFGGAAAQKRKDAPKEAILMLREQLDMLQKREKYLESQMDEQDAIARKNVTTNKTAAKNALRRKKNHEKNLEQTTAQIVQLEQQIYSIEAANINQETLNAMKAAGAAMTQIHGSMTIDKVDETMDKLREQHQLSEEIAQAITSSSITEQPDEADLEAELEGLEQEAMDERMLKTGTVPVADQLNRLPAAANGEREFTTPLLSQQAQSLEHKQLNLKPLVKTQPTHIEEDDEEAELEKLRAEMAMG